MGLLLAAFASALVVTSGYSASSLTGAEAAGFPGGPHFVVQCGFTHRNNDDAVVFPGQPGRSHNHTYVGNFSVDASTQVGSLLGGRTSCDVDADSSAYWAPTLYVGRRSVLPLAGFAYYIKRTSSDVVAHPPGLKMIAGSAAALRPQPTSIAAWSCGELGGGRKFATIPACARNHLLQLQITFPNCGQGRSLDSPNHKLHMAYASAGTCPASHPIALPTLLLILVYPEVPVQSQVASGRFGIHADFMNGWNQEALARLVAALNRGA